MEKRKMKKKRIFSLDRAWSFLHAKLFLSFFWTDFPRILNCFPCFLLLIATVPKRTSVSKKWRKGKGKKWRKIMNSFHFLCAWLSLNFLSLCFLNEFFTFFFLAENRSIYRLIGKTKIAQVSSQTGMWNLPPNYTTRPCSRWGGDKHPWPTPGIALSYGCSSSGLVCITACTRSLIVFYSSLFTRLVSVGGVAADLVMWLILI
jgi:hypothetical protein